MIQIHTYIHTYYSFSISFSIMVYHRILNILPCAIQLLLISHLVVSNSWDPMDCNLLSTSVHGVFLLRILEWVAISFSISIDFSDSLNSLASKAGILLICPWPVSLCHRKLLLHEISHYPCISILTISSSGLLLLFAPDSAQASSPLKVILSAGKAS